MKRAIVGTTLLFTGLGCGTDDGVRELAELPSVEAPQAPAEAVNEGAEEVREPPRWDGEPLPFGQDVTEAMRGKQRRLGAPRVGKDRRRGRVERRRPRVVRRDERGFALRLPDPLPVGTPTVHDGKVVVGAGLWMGAVEAKSGELVWARSTIDMSPTTAACEGELCAWSTFSCTVAVVEAASGQLVSNTFLGPIVLSAPAMADGVVYAAFEDTAGGPGERFSGGIAAVDARTGEEKWSRRMERDALGAPVVDGHDLHVATWGGTLHRFAREDGEVISSSARFAAGPPLLREEGLLFTRLVQQDGDWRAQVIHEGPREPTETTPTSPASELLSWPAPRGRAAIGQLFPDARPRGDWPPALAEEWPGPQTAGYIAAGPYSDHELFAGHSIVAAGDLDVMVLGDDIVAFDGQEVVWSHSLAAAYDHPTAAPYLERKQIWGRYLKMDLRGYPPATLAASPTRVVATTLGGEALVMDAASGAVLQTLDVGYPVATEPTLMDGWIYVGTATGHVVGLDTTDREVHGWSHYRGNARRTGHPQA